MNWVTGTLREIRNELNAGLRQLKRGETWLIIGLLSFFGLLAWAVAHFAFRTDTVLVYMRYTIGNCRELTNGPIIFLFCGMIFFLLAAVVTVGEFQQYFDNKRRGALQQARQALHHALIWAAVAVAISVAALLFFNAYCR